MRTTIRIDDELYRSVRARAAAAGDVDPLPTYGGRGLAPGVDLTSNAALRETMDQDTAADTRR